MDKKNIKKTQKNEKKTKKTLKRNPEAKCMVCTWLKNTLREEVYWVWFENKIVVKWKYVAVACHML